MAVCHSSLLLVYNEALSQLNSLFLFALLCSKQYPLLHHIIHCFIVIAQIYCIGTSFCVLFISKQWCLFIGNNFVLQLAAAGYSSGENSQTIVWSDKVHLTCLS